MPASSRSSFVREYGMSPLCHDRPRVPISRSALLHNVERSTLPLYLPGELILAAVASISSFREDEICRARRICLH